MYRSAWSVRSTDRTMSQRRKNKTLAFLLLFPFALLYVIIYFVVVPRTSNAGDYYLDRDRINGTDMMQVLCVNSDLGVGAPLADGLVMRPHVRPSEWNHFDGSSETITDQRIFFHETSGRGELSLKECCALESAAKHNPDKPIQLFVRPAKSCSSASANKPLHQSTLLYNPPPWLDVLSKYPNVQVILVNEEHYFAGSMLHDWYARGEWRHSKFEIAHLSNYIRILTLSKRGGMYLDIDIIVMKPLRGNLFRNFLAYGDEGKNRISNGAMHLELGHSLAGEMMSIMAEEYDPSSYVYNGPDVISDVMYRVCGLVAGEDKFNSSSCKDVHVLPAKVFYPTPSIFSHTLFLESNRTDTETLKKIRQGYGLHLWHSISRHHDPLDVTSQHQLIAIIAREHCPATVARAAEFVLL